MGFELSLFHGGINKTLVQKQAVDEIMKMSTLTEKYGLILTQQQAVALVETRSAALRKTGRIEFGGGVIEKMITEFCDSRYIYSQNYEETLHELVEIFYYYKNETLDLISDDELIRFMKQAFDGVCQGSLELLYGRELERMAHNLRQGRPADYEEDTAPLEDKEDEDGEH